jgi:stage II sporulation protein E
MALCGLWTLLPLPALAVGGILGRFLPEQEAAAPRRGETGMAQVRLELSAGVFSQVQTLLLESTPQPIDEEALILRAASNACGSCPCRKTCREREATARLSPQLLHKPLLDGHDLPVACRKESRLLQELHRAQEQLRSLRATREQQREYRSALLQQYQFLAEYLRDLSDALGRRIRAPLPRYKPQVSLCAHPLGTENGDRCQSFGGTGCKHYVLLCDGMGTGIGAVDEGAAAGSFLKRLLLAGFPAEYALRSLNSLCALRGMAGAVTVDLAELQLDTGKVVLYKWGAAPSWVLRETGAEKIGTAGPPPGLSVMDARETVERLSLRRGETLVLCSDGVDGEAALQETELPQPPGELAAWILEAGAPESGDDATVAVVRLAPEF